MKQDPLKIMKFGKWKYKGWSLNHKQNSGLLIIALIDSLYVSQMMMIGLVISDTLKISL